MNIYFPVRFILILWFLVAAVGFYPVSIFGRIKLNNVLDLFLLFTVFTTFFCLVDRVKVSLRLEKVSLTFLLFLASWVPGFAFAEDLGFSLRRYFIFACMAIVVIFMFLLPRTGRGWLWEKYIWNLFIFLICTLLVVSYILVGVTEYGRVTLPGYQDGVLVYRYVEGVGLLPDPNVLSYGIGFVYILSLAYSGFRPVLFFWLVITFFLVGSRSALLSFFLAMSYWFFVENKFHRGYLLAVAMVSAIFALVGITFFHIGVLERFKNPENYVERYDMWLTLLDAYLSSGVSIFLGNGFSAARNKLGDPHNFYFSVLYDGGILALTCLLLVYIASFKYVAINFVSEKKSVAYTLLIFNLLIGNFYWQDQMFFVPFFLIWLLSVYKSDGYLCGS